MSTLFVGVVSGKHCCCFSKNVNETYSLKDASKIILCDLIREHDKIEIEFRFFNMELSSFVCFEGSFERSRVETRKKDELENFQMMVKDKKKPLNIKVIPRDWHKVYVYVRLCVCFLKGKLLTS